MHATNAWAAGVVLAVVVACGCEACDDGSVTVDLSGSEPTGGVVTEKPANVSLDLGPANRKRVADAIVRGGTIRLQIGGVELPLHYEHITGLRVFVNMPDADESTPDRDPHLAGSIAFPTGDDVNRTYGFYVNIAEALSRLSTRGELDLEKPLEITLVPLIVRDMQPATAPLRIPFTRVEVVVPKSKR